jgi:hypothetical protein
MIKQVVEGRKETISPQGQKPMNGPTNQIRGNIHVSFSTHRGPGGGKGYETDMSKAQPWSTLSKVAEEQSVFREVY